MLPFLSALYTALSAYLLAVVCSPRVHMNLSLVDWTDAWVFVHLVAAWAAVSVVVAVAGWAIATVFLAVVLSKRGRL